MNLILAPTDFSKASRSAINYAAEIAKRTKAKLVLLHIYQPVIVPSETPVVLPLSEEIEKESLRKLRRIRYQLLTKHGRRFNVELSSREGVIADEIQQYAQEQAADLIVMGTHGAGFLEEKLVGSVTSDLIAMAKTPVLSVPANSKFKSIKKILLATDYQALSRPNMLDPIKEVSDMFNSHIYILNVIAKNSDLPTVSQAVEGVKLENILQAQNHSFHTEVNPDVVKGINRFAEERQMDMLVMVPRHHNVLSTLFNKRNTKHMAFHTKAPLLTIHN